MTHEDIVYDRRVRVIEHAAKIGNVSEACRVFGVSRKGERKERGANALPTHVPGTSRVESVPHGPPAAYCSRGSSTRSIKR